MHRCDCSPSGFKSSCYSLRATVLLQMLIVFLPPTPLLSLCLSLLVAFLSLSPSLFTRLILYTLSHTHSHCLARRERLEGGIWTYLTNGHPSLSSAAPRHHPEPLCVVFASSPFVSSFALFYRCVAYNYIPPLPLVWRRVETRGKAGEGKCVAVRLESGTQAECKVGSRGRVAPNLPQSCQCHRQIAKLSDAAGSRGG